MKTKTHIIGASRLLTTYGRHTPWHNIGFARSYEVAMPQTTASNHWSSSENSSNNAWNVNFGTGNLNNNNNNNNKNNNLIARPAVAHDSEWIALRAEIQVAYEDCLRGKSSSKQCQEYLAHADEDLDDLTSELISRVYEPDISTCFLVKYPKLREVFAAAFRDRVIHHFITLRVEPLFEELYRSFGNVTHNCRVGFGTKTAVESVNAGIKKVTRNYQKDAIVFKGDLVGFFMSIPKQRMCDKLLQFVGEKYKGDYKHLLLWLIKVTVMHHPEKKCVFNSKPGDWVGLPANKSLFRCKEGSGMPIGNLTTQQFANFYMTEFDGFVILELRKHRTFLRRRNEKFYWSYNRFVDDFVIVCNDKEFLSDLVKRCGVKLRQMGLELHTNKRYIQPAKHGLMFVGTYIHNGRMYLGNRTLGRFRERVHGFIKYLEKPEIEVTLSELESIRNTINSYLGFCKNRKTYKLRRAILREFTTRCQKYYHRGVNSNKIKLKRKYRPIYK